ncbi:hypothetical protein D3C87_1274750 [compost metagenome]
MQENRRFRTACTNPLPIDRVPIADIEHAALEGFDLGIEAAQFFGHVLLSFRWPFGRVTIRVLPVVDR